MLIFVSGAVRSGKSALGETLANALAQEKRKIYLATSRLYDQEMTQRIRSHQQQRADKAFLTIEQPQQIGQVLHLFHQEDTVLLDCLGTLLANQMFENIESPASPAEIRDRILRDLNQLQQQTAHLIVISNEVFADGICYDQTTEDYIHTLGQLHRELVAHSDVAVECLYAIHLCHKGQLPV